MLVGNFNSGKTTLCLKALKNDVDVVSADQTHLCYKKDKMVLVCGSSYMKIDKDNEMFLETNNSGIEVKLIINIVGVCDNGKLNFDLVDNKNHKIKKLFNSCTWHANIPLFTKPIMLDIDRIKIYKWLDKINLPFYDVRGDSGDIISKIKEVVR